MILYKQFNFGLAPQTFGLVTSSNSLPEGQPHLFIFVSPCKLTNNLLRDYSGLAKNLNFSLPFGYIKYFSSQILFSLGNS